MMWPFRRPAPSRASRIAIQPPKPEAARASLALVLIARNEAARIGDWLTFHALAGVSHVYLYDNGSTDQTAQIARDFTGCSVTIIPWKLDTSEAKTGMILPRQILAYAHAICTFGAGYQRMGFTDTDEYLVPHTTLTLPEALAALPSPNISLPWTMFGHGGHKIAPPDAVPFAFQQRAPEAVGPLLNFKCIVDPCDVTQVSTHKFHTRSQGDVSSNTLGQTAPNARRTGSFVTQQAIQLNHYYLMSEEEMQAKISGPAVSGSAQKQRAAAVLRKAALIEENPITDTAAIDFLARHGITNTQALRARFAG
ncbi:glycosyltransferase family 92 protein [Yoonia sp. F2084L]|uniref:glycosyltransferase family 92 protein n=1 Tax=Yoonia sp. F2084L TaxID=2926419 RepID=UPI001FF60885|nr:glycosyltransferase family 92 protein [Yoonia sp. F2084L]MCK0096448.1 glycosyltransferase family 92 protein [Yoonia sp. F2084L]